MVRRDFQGLEESLTSLTGSIVEPVQVEVILQAEDAAQVLLGQDGTILGIADSEIQEGIADLEQACNAQLIPVDEMLLIGADAFGRDRIRTLTL